MENKNKNTLINNNTTKSTKSHKNRIKNWTAYNTGLVNRGNFTFLIEKSLLVPPQQTGKAGHPLVYSDALILVLAELREFTQLPFRQLIGLARSLAGLNHVELPSYSSLCKRMSKLNIPSNVSCELLDNGFLFLVDSTGLKTDGEGEWFRHKHGKHERRGWIKLHIGIDYKSEQIVAYESTLENVADGTVLPELVDNTEDKHKIGQIIGDGAYTYHKLYRQIEEERGLSLLAPPHKNAKMHMSFEHGHPGRRCSGGNYAKLIDDPGWETHNKYVREVMRLGLGKWKDEVGYHKRSLVETTMYRLKTAFSGNLKSRKAKNRNIEIAIRVSLLNRWTTQSMPTYT